MSHRIELFGYQGKSEVLSASARFWNPGKTQFWLEQGIPLVIGERSGYWLHDVDGHVLLDMHLNGGTYNLGHRNPRLVGALTTALEKVDLGNHHFPSPGRAALAEALLATTDGRHSKVCFTTSGSEAIDLAIKSARFATGKTVIVSIENAYHGHTGLALNTGAERFARMFHSSFPGAFRHVPFNDVEAMRAALEPGDVAAVLMETIPATYGFPLPEPSYLRDVQTLCREAGSLYIADEVQTGLGRTGTLWAIDQYDVEPDLLVTSKGLGGGLYPIAATLLDEQSAAWLDIDGFAHMSTFGGSELGCAVALEVLRITQEPRTSANVQARAAQFADGLSGLRARFPNWLVEVRQHGLVIGLVFSGEGGAQEVMKELYNRGVWAIFSTLDPRVLQFKPGLLISEEETGMVLRILTEALEATALPVVLS